MWWGSNTLYKRIIFPDAFAVFEFSAFELNCSPPNLCDLLYHSSKFNRDYIAQFSDFLSDTLPKYDHVLIPSDFKICCPKKPRATDFLTVIDSFSSDQLVDVPTHERSHTLDLVLAQSLTITDLSVVNLQLLVNFPVLFCLDSSRSWLIHRMSMHPVQSITLSKVLECSALFTDAVPSLPVSSDSGIWLQQLKLCWTLILKPSDVSAGNSNEFGKR